MRARHLLGLAALALIVGNAAPARADFNIATGLKWVPLRYTGPVAIGAAGMGGGPTGSDLYGWQTTSLDNYLAFFFTEQIGIQLSLDLGWATAHTDVNNMNNADDTYFQLGVALGGKFYLNRPTRERVSPYLYVDFFKYFASVSTTRNITNDQAAFVAGLHSPVGLDFAFGAEYFFTTSFSLGAEVLGIRYAYVEGDFDAGGGRLTQKNQYLTLYTAISLNYRFLATARVYTYEEEEDKQSPRTPARRQRPRPVAPPPEDNAPPSPESVD